MTTMLLLILGAADLWLVWCFGKVLREYFHKTQEGKATND